MNGDKKYDSKQLLFRRQFVLGPSFLDSLHSWKHISIAARICLSAHPDLNTAQVARGGMSLTLIGYILDPDSPDADDAAILDMLFTHLLKGIPFQEWVKHTESLGGRWILIVNDVAEITLFTDPMGLRQVFYTDTALTKDVWCATQPGIIADALHLKMDQVALDEYVASPAFQAWDEYLWPADTSPYREIRHLLPNHRLNLNSGICSRYWPDRSLRALTLQEGVQISSTLLRGLLESAARRFDLAHALSAGWDSRLLLAASKNISRQVFYFTYSRGGVNADVTITPKLLAGLGLEDHIVAVPGQMNDKFASIFRRNVTFAHDLFGRFMEALYEVYPQGRVCVTGNAAEIARVRFRLSNGEEGVTARRLARYTSFQLTDEMEKIGFVVRAWERWLSGVGEIYNINTLDLFYWEHYGGNFAAIDQTESDLVCESFTPYNCRKWLTSMLSIDERFRDHDLPIVYQETIKSLWPEVLNEPVNPRAQPDLVSAARSTVIALLRRAGVHRIAKNCLTFLGAVRR